MHFGLIVPLLTVRYLDELLLGPFHELRGLIPVREEEMQLELVILQELLLAEEAGEPISTQRSSNIHTYVGCFLAYSNNINIEIVQIDR